MPTQFEHTACRADGHTSNQVRTSPPFGNAYAARWSPGGDLPRWSSSARVRRQRHMRLAGLENVGAGHLFEPNDTGRPSRRTTSSDHPGFTLTHGTFEANAAVF
jgi:hypothetical protein